LATSSMRAPGRAAGRSFRRRALVPAVALLSLSASACTQIDNALAKVPIFAFLREAPFFDPYEHPLPAPPGSVPFLSPNGGELLPPLEATEQALNAFAASPYGQNPLAADDTAALRVGQLMYERHCFVCHGTQGLGDGPIIAPNKFAFPPPSLLAAPAATRSDGYVYGVIRAGRGLMPAYGARMTHMERWAIVNYVNSLQAAAGAAAPQPAAAQPAAGAPLQPVPAAPPADTAARTGAAADTTASQHQEN
jgi:mono/diheme cytochrome c family protein